MTEKRVLVVGFDPFDGQNINASGEAVRALARVGVEDTELLAAEIPTDFARLSRALKRLLEKESPDVVICVGQARGRDAVVDRSSFSFAVII